MIATIEKPFYSKMLASNINKETVYGIISELKNKKYQKIKKSEYGETSHNSRNRYRTQNS